VGVIDTRKPSFSMIYDDSQFSPNRRFDLSFARDSTGFVALENCPRLLFQSVALPAELPDQWAVVVQDVQSPKRFAVLLDELEAQV